jgi:hypothetical protein
MSSAALFPDSIQAIVDYLTPLHDPLPVGIRNPEEGDSYIKVRRVGGVQTTRVSEAGSFAIECYGTDDTSAFTLALAVRRDVKAMQGTTLGDVLVYKVEEIGGPGELPDPSAPNLTRYSFIVAVTLRGLT